MGTVVNKSFEKLERSIARKAEKLLEHLLEHNGTLYGKWTRRKDKMYLKLGDLCEDLVEEISYLDEIELPEFEKDKD